MRYMTGSLSVQGWYDLFKEAFRCTKPGGYFESFEAAPFFTSDDGTVTETSALSQWGKLFVEGGKKIGATFSMVVDGTQTKGMEEAGYVDIEERDFKVSRAEFPQSKPFLLLSWGDLRLTNSRCPWGDGQRTRN